MKLLRLTHVTEKTALSRATIYRLIRAGQFPRPIKAIGVASRWLDPEIDEWILGYTARYDRADDEKDVIPWTYCRKADGKHEWRAKGFPKPRPLYGLDKLARQPEFPVLIVEGEKTADAASGSPFADHVVLTWPGGTNSVA